MTASYAPRVHQVMDHVRHNLDADLSLSALAKVARFSPHHFHRVFKAHTGETLTAYVQRARLERAAQLMQAAPSKKLDSIALEVGFSAHSDFTRVFKKRYGLAPTQWDRKQRLQPETVADDYTDVVARARRDRPPALVRIVDQPARRLMTVRTNAPFVGPALHDGYQRLTGYLEDRGVDWRTETLLGWSWDNPETTPLSNVHFDFGFTIGDEVEPEGEFLVQTFPAHRAAQIHCHGPLVDIAVAWEALFGEWLPASAHEPDDLPGFKVFRCRPDELGWARYDLDCSLAVRPLRP